MGMRPDPSDKKVVHAHHFYLSGAKYAVSLSISILAQGLEGVGVEDARRHCPTSILGASSGSVATASGRHPGMRPPPVARPQPHRQGRLTPAGQAGTQAVRNTRRNRPTSTGYSRLAKGETALWLPARSMGPRRESSVGGRRRPARNFIGDRTRKKQNWELTLAGGGRECRRSPIGIQSWQGDGGMPCPFIRFAGSS